MGSVTKSEETVGENLMRRSYARKDEEQKRGDAMCCKQTVTRHGDEYFLVDQSARKCIVEKD